MHLKLLHTLKTEEIEHLLTTVVEEKITTTKLATLKKRRPPQVVHDVVSSRCNRSTMMWELTLQDGTVLKVKQAVIKMVKFKCSYKSGGGGCGAGYYIGQASGKFNPKTRANPKGGWGLTFDDYFGEFNDKETGKEITRAKKIVLLPDCKSVYFPVD